MGKDARGKAAADETGGPAQARATNLLSEFNAPFTCSQPLLIPHDQFHQESYVLCRVPFFRRPHPSWLFSNRFATIGSGIVSLLKPNSKGGAT